MSRRISAACPVCAGKLPRSEQPGDGSCRGRAESFPIQVQTTITDVVSYTFALPNDDYLLALWADGEAVDYDPGTPVTLILPGFSDYKVTGIDVLYGFEQPIITSVAGGDLIIHDLLVKDYAIILRLAPTRYLYLPVL